MKNLFFIIALILSIPILSKAQVISTHTLSLEGAQKIMAEAIKFAKEKNAPGAAIAIVDAGGNLILMERLDGTFAAASEVSIKKANTSALFKAPSSKLENSINSGRNALITVGHTFLQGGIPIVYLGEVIGAIGVSGSASAQQDEDIAISGSKVNL